VLEGTIDTGYDFGFYTPRLDLGDAPNAYQTLFGQGAAHIVFPDGGDGRPDTAGSRPAVWLGSIVDVEADGQPTTDARATARMKMAGLQASTGGRVPRSLP
jgi:hypothetical protein